MPLPTHPTPPPLCPCALVVPLCPCVLVPEAISRVRCACVCACVRSCWGDRFVWARNVSWTREPAHLFAACIMCTVQTLRETHPSTSVFLLSDKVESLALADYLPPDVVSSPLALEGALPPIHVDKPTFVVRTPRPLPRPVPTMFLGSALAQSIGCAASAYVCVMLLLLLLLLFGWDRWTATARNMCRR
jgi:hypothetical protein